MLVTEDATPPEDDAAELAAASLRAAMRARAPEIAARGAELADLAVTLGRRCGLGGAELEAVRLTCLLADVGALGLPDELLRPAGRRGEADDLRRRAVPRLGAELLAGVAPLAVLAPAVRATRERWDGGGYPDGLEGDAIPPAARVVAICRRWQRDVRREGVRPGRLALARLDAEAGRRHDPGLARALARLLREAEAA